jgi:hypothetical protein
MREIRLFASEGGAPLGIPTPISILRQSASEDTKAGKLSGAAPRRGRCFAFRFSHRNGLRPDKQDAYPTFAR